MPKLTPAQMKAAVEEFKKKFTTGFYHGSPSPNIKAFDPFHMPSEAGVSADAAGEKAANAIFLTKDPSFANSFLPSGSARGYKPGSAVYPVSANLGKHFDYETPEGHKLINKYLETKWQIPDDASRLAEWAKHRSNHASDLKQGIWSAIEDPSFQDFLRANNYDSFALQEAGRKNVGIFEPQNIRGKFAKFNPNEANNPDFMKAEGGLIGYAPGGTVKKALEFAKSIPFVHFSKADNIARLEPNMYGTGVKGAEGSRLQDAADIRPRSYFYVDTPNVKPEAGLGAIKYRGVSEASYPLSTDPAGYYKIAKELAKDPYFAKQGVEIIDRPKMLNEVERAIKNAGYSGYHVGDETGIVFHPTDVVKIWE